MKNGFTVFIAALIALGASWTAFVLGAAVQLGHEKSTTVLNGSDVYPIQRAGEATLGLQVYRANGCAACHTEQVQQYGMACEISLTSVGKNPAAVEKNVNAQWPLELRAFKGVQFRTNDSNVPFGGPPSVNISHLPQIILNNLTEEKASAIGDAITAAGGKSETRIVATGGDITRGWGVRHSVAADYLYDYPVQLGSLRAGPDLAAIGVRMADEKLQLQHLYAPKSVNQNSAMPPFKFLFEVRKIGATPAPEALNLPKEFAPAAGYEVVPKPEAKQLAAYLLSLRADAPLYEAPFTPPTPATNAPATK